MSLQMARASQAPSHQPAGKLFLAIGFVLSSIFTAGLGYFGQRYYFDYQNERTDAIAKVNAFERQSGDLPSLVANLNRALIQSKNAQRERDAIAANVREQYRTLSDAMPHVSIEDKVITDQYLLILVNMAENIQGADSALTVGPFLQEFEYSVVYRQKIVHILRENAGLKTGDIKSY